MKVLQFLAVQEPRLTARLARSAASRDAVVILDLEDALWDVTDERRTTDLKAKGRRDLIDLAIGQPDLFAQRRIGVRLNKWSSPEALLDIEALATIARLVELEAIVVTKVESESDLMAWVTALADNHVAFGGLVPIVETRAGIANLDEIAGAARRLGIEWLVYGHWDYGLDCGWWPLPDHDEAAFWESALPVLERLERHGLGYVHPPYFQLHDMARFSAILGRLTTVCRREFGVITLGSQQTLLASSWLTTGGDSPTRPMPDAGIEHPDARATRIVESFIANKRQDVSFALDVPRGEFISPHVYLAAREHLRRLVRA